MLNLRERSKNLISLIIFQLALLLGQSGLQLVFDYNQAEISVISSLEAKSKEGVCDLSSISSTFECLKSKTEKYGLIDALIKLGWTLMGLALTLFFVQILLMGGGSASINSFLIKFAITALLFVQLPDLLTTLAQSADSAFKTLKVDLSNGKKIKKMRKNYAQTARVCEDFNKDLEKQAKEKKVTMKPVASCCKFVCDALTKKTGGFAVCNWTCEMQKSADYLKSLAYIDALQKEGNFTKKAAVANATRIHSNTDFAGSVAEILLFLFLMILFVIQYLVIPVLLLMIYLSGLVGLPISLLPGGLGGSISEVIKSLIAMLIWPVLIVLCVMVLMDVSLNPLRDVLASVQNQENPDWEEVQLGGAWMTTLATLIAGPVIISLGGAKVFGMIQGIINGSVGSLMAQGVSAAGKEAWNLGLKGFDKAKSYGSSAVGGVRDKIKGKDATYKEDLAARSTVVAISSIGGMTEAVFRGGTGAIMGAGKLGKKGWKLAKSKSNNKKAKQAQERIEKKLRSGANDKELDEFLEEEYKNAEGPVEKMVAAKYIESRKAGKFSSRNYIDSSPIEAASEEPTPAQENEQSTEDLETQNGENKEERRTGPNEELEGQIKETNSEIAFALESDEPRIGKKQIKPHLSDSEIDKKASKVQKDNEDINKNLLKSEQRIYEDTQRSLGTFSQTQREGMNTANMTSTEKAAYKDYMANKDRSKSYSSSVIISQENAVKAGYEDSNEMLKKAVNQMIKSDGEMSFRAGDKVGEQAIKDVISGKTLIADPFNKDNNLDHKKIENHYKDGIKRDINKSAKSLRAGLISHLEERAEKGSQVHRNILANVKLNTQKSGILAIEEKAFDKLIDDSFKELKNEDGSHKKAEEIEELISSKEEKIDDKLDLNKQLENTVDYFKNGKAGTDFMVLASSKRSGALSDAFSEHCQKAKIDMTAAKALSSAKYYMRGGSIEQFDSATSGRSLGGIDAATAENMISDVKDYAKKEEEKISKKEGDNKAELRRLKSRSKKIIKELENAGKAGDLFNDALEAENLSEFKKDLSSHNIGGLPLTVMENVFSQLIDENERKKQEIEDIGPEKAQQEAEMDQKRDEILSAIDESYKQQNSEAKLSDLNKNLAAYMKSTKSSPENLPEKLKAEIKNLGAKEREKLEKQSEKDYNNLKTKKQGKDEKNLEDKYQSLRGLFKDVKDAGATENKRAAISGISRVDIAEQISVSKSARQALINGDTKDLTEKLNEMDYQKLSPEFYDKMKSSTEQASDFLKTRIEYNDRNKDQKSKEINSNESKIQSLLKDHGREAHAARILLSDSLSKEDRKEALENAELDKLSKTSLERINQAFSIEENRKMKQIVHLEIDDKEKEKQLDEAEKERTEKLQSFMEIRSSAIKESASSQKPEQAKEEGQQPIENEISPSVKKE